MSTKQRYDFLLSSLPSLDDLGSPPPMLKQDFLERVANAKGPVKTLEVIFLSDDLVQREAFTTGELSEDDLDLAVLDLNGPEGELSLPDYLVDESETETQDSPRLAMDSLWARYFNYTSGIAKSQRSSFLKAWVGFEVGLRNALTTARAQTLELDPSTYWVTPELSDPDLDTTTILNAWSAASDPLEALNALDKARWEWLTDNGCWYSFRAEEIESYAAKLLLLHRWRRLAADETTTAKR